MITSVRSCDKRGSLHIPRLVLILPLISGGIPAPLMQNRQGDNRHPARRVPWHSAEFALGVP